MAAFLIVNLYSRGAKKAFRMALLGFPALLLLVYLVITRKLGWYP